MWTITEGQEVKIDPELVPEHVWKYLARDTVAAVRRFYSIPENRAKFEKWKAERDTRKEEKS